MRSARRRAASYDRLLMFQPSTVKSSFSDNSSTGPDANIPLRSHTAWAIAGATLCLSTCFLTGCRADPAPTPLYAPTVAPAPTAVPPPAHVVTTPGHYTWRPVKIIGGGFVDGIDFSPVQRGLIYARTDIGGAYRWDARAKQWVSLSDWITADDSNLMGTESIGVDPVDAKRVYLAVGTYTQSWAGQGAILRSDDQGRTFQRTNLPFKNGGNENGRHAGERLAIDPNDDKVIIYGSRHDGLWRSTDFGATWQKVNSYTAVDSHNGLGTVFELFDRSSGRKGAPTPTIYAAVSNTDTSLYRSTDAGATWAPVPGQPTGMVPEHGVMTREGLISITFSNAPGPNDISDGAVWQYDTHSGSWSDISPAKGTAGGKLGSGYSGLAVDPRHPGTILVSTLDRWNPGDTVFRTTDGGAHWVSLRDDAVIDDTLAPFMNFGGASPKFGWWMGALAADPFASGHVLFGTGATIWASDDVTAANTGGKTHWYVGADGIEETVVNQIVSPPSGASLLSTMWDIDGFRHDNINVSPAAGFFQPAFGRDTGIDFAESNPNVVVRLTGGRNNHGAYSLDNGVTWKEFGSAPASNGDGTVGVSADGSTYVVAPERAPAYYTSDNGTTWTASVGTPSGIRVCADRVDPKRFYGIANGAVYASNDGGVTFTAAAASVPDVELKATPGHTGDVWLASNQGLYHSTDFGMTFQKIEGIDQANRVGYGKAAPGSSYPTVFFTGKASGVYGFYRSDDGGINWVRINDDAHNYGNVKTITGDPRVYGRLYIGSDNRGIAYGDPT